MAFNYPPIGPFTVTQAMQACGIDTVAKATTLASELFDNDYADCKDKRVSELLDGFKVLHKTPVAQGGVKVPLRVQAKIKAFCQWTKDQLRTGLDPTAVPFPVLQSRELLARAETHDQFVKNYTSVASAAIPKDFGKDTKWDDWSPTFWNYLNAIPGRDGIPLSYIIRDNDDQDHTPNTNFLDDYVMAAPLAGASYEMDARKVHAFIQTRIMGNDEAEAAIKPHETANDGRKDWKALKEQYEGTGVYAFDITKAEDDLHSMIYSGEKRPTMYWTLFETRLNRAFHILAKVEGVAYSDAMKLRKLLRNIQCDWLQGQKNTVKGELSKHPIVYTYKQALSLFRTEVNQRYPSGSQRDSSRRAISETGRGSRGGRGGQGGRGGRGSRGNRAPPTRQYENGEHIQKTRDDSEIFTLNNGKRIEYHPSFRFDDHTFKLFTQDQYERLMQARKAYKNKRDASQLDTLDVRSIAQMVARQLQGDQSVPGNVSVGSTPSASISQVTSSLMGGRNSQANKKQRGDRE